MKNLHLLDADKPSRLFYLASNLHLEQGQLIAPKNYQNIYITSDETPKDGDVCMVAENHLNTLNILFTSTEEITAQWRKIILTTDQHLITDGVQAIDDEFLEWFVNNPSCEEVEIEKQIGCIDLDAVCDFGEGYCPYTPDCLKNKYKIIIPKEEPKQETLEEFALKNSKYINHSNINYSKQEAIILGAKWQQDKILELLKNNDYGNDPVFEFLEEEFKKK